VPDAKAFHFGSYAMVVEPTASTLKNLVERQCQRSVIAYDPNVRLNVEPRIGVWRDTLDWMAERSHVIKVSEEDLTLLFPDQNVETIAKSLLRAGTSLVVVTRGEKGCWSWSGVNRFAEVPGQQVALVDTVGAGDAFQAGLLSRLAEKELLKPDGIKQLTPMQLHDVLTFATKTAALACSKRGADLPRRIEVAML
jgi:fructokinase